MHEIDLKKYNIRTDLIIDDFIKDKSYDGIKYNINNYKDICVEEIVVDAAGESSLGRKKGIYKTISFKDITDKDNYKDVEDVFIKTLNDTLKDIDIKESASVLVIGLGNDSSTPDSLGPKVISNILVTRHLYSIGEVESGYRNVCSLIPDVCGKTGIETFDIIMGVINIINVDFIIIIDALASSSLDRLNKTIQITDTGIQPGSGVGNTRCEISKDKLGIPVIVIGVPTIVDAATIVSDTFKYLFKQISFNLDNINNDKLKLIPLNNQNYLDHDNNLNKKDKEKLLGIIGSLDDNSFKELVYEVLSPINYNMMVTPKEIDYIIDKLSLLIGNGINKVLHKSLNTTNY